jgi:hypothetical protein
LYEPGSPNGASHAGRGFYPVFLLPKAACFA